MPKLNITLPNKVFAKLKENITVSKYLWMIFNRLRLIYKTGGTPKTHN